MAEQVIARDTDTFDFNQIDYRTYEKKARDNTDRRNPT